MYIYDKKRKPRFASAWDLSSFRFVGIKSGIKAEKPTGRGKKAGSTQPGLKFNSTFEYYQASTSVFPGLSQSHSLSTSAETQK